MSPRENLAHSQLQPLASPQLLCLSPSEKEMLLGMELMGAPVQHPATSTTNPLGTGAGPQHVLLRVFRVLLSHPSQPMGHLCAVSFITWHLHLVIGHQSQAP